MHRLPLTLLLLGLTSCGKARAPLHDLPSFAGKVAIRWSEGSGPRNLEGELVFDRASRHLQWVVRGATTVSLAQVENGKPEAFENGVPRPATERELEDFRIVKALVVPEPGKTPVLASAPDGYRATVDGKEFTVSTIETIRGHGQR